MPKISLANCDMSLTKSEAYFVTDFVTVFVVDCDRYYEKFCGCNYDLLSDRFLRDFVGKKFVKDFVMFFVINFTFYCVKCG